MNVTPLLLAVVGACALAGAAYAYEPNTSKFPPDKAALPSWLENMRPGQIRDAVAQGAPCLLPVGTLESEGDDSPLGIDAVRYKRGLEQLAKQRKAVIAPPIWYAPTGYILGGASEGTFHMDCDAFARYLEEVLITLGELGFRRVEIVPMHDPQGESGPLRTACMFAKANRFNDLWKDPQFGPNWWIRPDLDKLNWARYAIRELPKSEGGTKKEPVPRKGERPEMVLPLRLEHMRPSELKQAVERGLPLLVPVGVVENHGNHNPVGCDAIEAQDPVLLAAGKAPAVVAPTVWYGPTGYAVTGPKLGTTDIGGPAFQDYMEGVVSGLAAMGFRNLIFVQVHQGSAGPQHTAIKMAIAEYRAHLHKDPRYGPGWGQDERLKRQVPSMEVIHPPHGQYDHAGKNETSWMLHLRGPCTDLGLLREGDYPFCWGKGGESNKATAEWGRQMTEKAVEALVRMIQDKTTPPSKE